jgi:hypothetical protein
VLGFSSSPDPSRAASEMGGIERFWTTCTEPKDGEDFFI